MTNIKNLNDIDLIDLQPEATCTFNLKSHSSDWSMTVISHLDNWVKELVRGTLFDRLIEDMPITDCSELPDDWYIVDRIITTKSGSVYRITTENGEFVVTRIG